MAGGDLRLGMVEYLSYKFAMSTEKVISHDYNIEPKRNLTPEAIATYLNLWKGRSVRNARFMHGSTPAFVNIFGLKRVIGDVP